MSDLRVLSPRLPLGALIRLRVEHHVDGFGGWLCAHRFCRSAELLWRSLKLIEEMDGTTGGRP